MSSASVSTAAEPTHVGAVDGAQAAWVHPDPPSLLDKILKSKVSGRL